MAAIQQVRLAAVAPAVGGGGITHDVDSPVNIDDATEDPENFTITIGNLTNGYITLELSAFSAGPTSVTFDGTAMAKVANNDSGGDIVQIWGVAVGSKGAGTYTVSMDFAAAGMEITCGATSWNGVHQTVSVGTAVQSNGTGPTATNVVTNGAGDVAVGAVNTFGSSAITTTDNEMFTGAGGATDGAAAYQTGTGSITIDWNTGSAQPWRAVGIPLKPA